MEQRKEKQQAKGTSMDDMLGGTKAENALEWVGKMDNIRACTMEIVNKEIIFA